MSARAALFRFLNDTDHDWFISRRIFNLIIKVHRYGYFYYNTELALPEWIYESSMVYRAYSNPIIDVYQFGFILCVWNQSRKNKYQRPKAT